MCLLFLCTPIESFIGAIAMLITNISNLNRNYDIRKWMQFQTGRSERKEEIVNMYHPFARMVSGPTGC